MYKIKGRGEKQPVPSGSVQEATFLQKQRT